jgi:hypothetical protein
LEGVGAVNQGAGSPSLSGMGILSRRFLGRRGLSVTVSVFGQVPGPDLGSSIGLYAGVRARARTREWLSPLQTANNRPHISTPIPTAKSQL